MRPRPRPKNGRRLLAAGDPGAEGLSRGAAVRLCRQPRAAAAGSVILARGVGTDSTHRFYAAGCPRQENLGDDQTTADQMDDMQRRLRGNLAAGGSTERASQAACFSGGPKRGAAAICRDADSARGSDTGSGCEAEATQCTLLIAAAARKKYQKKRRHTDVQRSAVQGVDDQNNNSPDAWWSRWYGEEIRWLSERRAAAFGGPESGGAA
ncbi:hypothetical protein DE146DRAFT_630392 [Phaeosphaeria sp. MPI-PUGE-AT-0046c]|nr:hypothetical protein DE146DRAFT_630392 [Phaeosphaeria sp. MPI-PUGE-AT-0046c]